MKEQLTKIVAPFKRHKGLKIAWLGLTILLIFTLMRIPALIGIQLLKQTDSPEVANAVGGVAFLWVLTFSIISLVYGLRNFHVRLSLFGSAASTAKLGTIGVFNLIGGGSAGVLLFVPSVFYFVFKLMWAGFLGYVALSARISANLLTRAFPSVRPIIKENE